MPDHEHYEELCALAAGGFLESAELVDLHAHLKECSECRSSYQEFSSLITRDLPQAQGTFGQKLAAMRAKPLPDSWQRFLRRARAEGVVFSRNVEAPARSGRFLFRLVTVAPIAFLVVLALCLVAYRFRETDPAQAIRSVAPHIAELERENSVLTASLSRLTESLAAGQREIQNLRAQLGSATATAEKLRESQGEAASSSSQNAQLLEESRNREKLLAEARDETARINQLKVNDEASLVEQQTRITQLSNKLRIASATLDQERQLVAAGKDIRELVAARQLHIVDVRDTDPTGSPSSAFGRVFFTEGKSLTFYAFDLDEDRVVNAKRGFQVWAVSEGGKNSASSLGFLRAEAKTQGRWVLRVENPGLLKAISSVFITVEPVAGGTQPSGEKMLYAYLGEANHP